MSETWSDDRVRTLKKLVAKGGLSASQIADRIGGVTRNAVIGKARRLEIDLPLKRGRPIRTLETV